MYYFCGCSDPCGGDTNQIPRESLSPDAHDCLENLAFVTSMRREDTENTIWFSYDKDQVATGGLLGLG